DFAVEAARANPVKFALLSTPDSGPDSGNHRMLILRGSRALSDFRIEKLLARARDTVPGLTQIDTRFIHLADVDGELPTAERAVLEKLLTYGEADTAGEPTGAFLLVLPRFGTISPWSSK